MICVRMQLVVSAARLTDPDDVSLLQALLLQLLTQLLDR